MYVQHGQLLPLTCSVVLHKPRYDRPYRECEPVLIGNYVGSTVCHWQNLFWIQRRYMHISQNCKTNNG